MENDEVEELSQRGEIFRSKLIEDFQLLDTLKSKGNIESPRFYSNEIQGIFMSIACFSLETKETIYSYGVYQTICNHYCSSFPIAISQFQK